MLQFSFELSSFIVVHLLSWWEVLDLEQEQEQEKENCVNEWDS
jgi:hypothetical protein